MPHSSSVNLGATSENGTLPASFVVQAQGGGQLDGLPMWAKVGATLTAISLICGLFTFLVVNMVHQQGSDVLQFERLIDKFDTILERHDTRSREWMKAHGERITSENAKTREVLTEMQIAAQENARLHEAQLTVLKQILIKDKMP